MRLIAVIAAFALLGACGQPQRYTNDFARDALNEKSVTEIDRDTARCQLQAASLRGRVDMFSAFVACMASEGWIFQGRSPA